MNEEEVIIGNGAKNDPKATPPKTAESNHENKMEPTIVDLESYFAKSNTNEDFLRKILETPEEKLIPWEECTLPSKGVYYGWPDGVVMVKAMGQAAEKVLATQRLAQSGQSIDYLFRECCKFPNAFDPADMLLGDRVFLLYYLRGITHGNLYEFLISCPECDASATHKYDLNDLASTIKWADASIGREPFRVVLPYITKATGRDVYVGLKFLRATDANEMLSQRKFRKQNFSRPANTVRSGGTMPSQRNKAKQDNSIDETLSDNLEKMIVNVMGIADPIAIKSFVAKLHSTDTATIREWMRENSPGIDTTVLITCPSCDHEFRAELPISESFFRPTKS